MQFTPDYPKWTRLLKLPDGDSPIDRIKTSAKPTGTAIQQSKKVNQTAVTDDTIPVFVSGVSSSGGSSVSQDYLLPPILELLAEGRARRQAQRDSIGAAISGLLQAAPMAASGPNAIFPGFERGGIADVLMGIVSGKGVQEGGATLDSLRRPGTTQIPISALLGVGEPSVQDEFGSLIAIAQAILGSGKMIQTGSSSQGSSSTNYDQVSGGAAGGLDPLTLALLSGMLGQGGVPQGGNNRNAGYGYNPDTGEIYFPQPSSTPVAVPIPTGGK